MLLPSGRRLCGVPVGPERISSTLLEKQVLQRLLLGERPLPEFCERLSEFLVEHGFAVLINANFERRFVDLIDRVEENVTLAGALFVSYSLDVADENTVSRFVQPLESGRFWLVGDENAGIDASLREDVGRKVEQRDDPHSLHQPFAHAGPFLNRRDGI